MSWAEWVFLQSRRQQLFSPELLLVLWRSAFVRHSAYDFLHLFSLPAFFYIILPETLSFVQTRISQVYVTNIVMSSTLHKVRPLRMGGGHVLAKPYDAYIFQDNKCTFSALIIAFSWNSMPWDGWLSCGLILKDKMKNERSKTQIKMVWIRPGLRMGRRRHIIWHGSTCIKLPDTFAIEGIGVCSGAHFKFQNKNQQTLRRNPVDCAGREVTCADASEVGRSDEWIYAIQS